MPAAPSLYRRHRPRSFADVVGQEHVVRTLRNAVEQDKLHHAYLFVGSRGTGKTSMAKILASCLNCVNGPTVEPCGVCDSCVAIASATSMDVIEMDAASNNSVDDIRELRESVSFAPVSGGWKVYILDEAHMLSTAAWNAFLKTLEEPPPQTIFVMATTEAQKVLPTVVDRCHRFDFARPTIEQLAAVVRRVAEQEGIEIGPDAVALLARHATGSFRDALGTLEQLVTYAGATIAVDDVLAVLGVADAELLFGSLDAVGAHDARAALLAAARLVSTGRDVVQFMKDLEGHARELLVVRTLGEVPAEIAVTPDRDARLAEQAQRLAPVDVVRLLDLIAAGLRAVKDGADARTHLELALVKAASPELDPGTKALVARLERLERGGTPTSVADSSHTQEKTTLVAPPAAAEPATPPAPPAAAAAPAAAPAPAAAAPAAPALAAPPPPVAVSLDLPLLTELWTAIVGAVRTENALIGTCLADALPIAFEDNELVIAFPQAMAFNRRRAEANRELIGASIRALAGAQPRLRFELREIEDDVSGAPPPTEEEWLARFKAEFDAEEIIPETEESQA
ncbi:MAG TPA: DNA polymerase III subunit gamma/tau [Solirubrobacteraceae bacterium]